MPRTVNPAALLLAPLLLLVAGANALVAPRFPVARSAHLVRASLPVMAGNYGGKAEEAVTARRKFSRISEDKFRKLEEQAQREPADRTAGKIVAAGLIVGLGGALGFAAANGYLTGPSML
mmetsp:Transcript_29844/g.80217  ORF Transcript_29844/g.80217 Transcript_29844/m.80217 type:complete len:120 (+) Transcript_29844:1718-2077(+)